MAGFLVWAQLQLFLVVSQFGISFDVLFLYHAQWPDDAQRHLSHAQQGRHGTEASLVEQVHQSRAQQVVLMVAECYLIASQLLCQVEELLTTVPLTKEAGRFRIL